MESLSACEACMRIHEEQDSFKTHEVIPLVGFEDKVKELKTLCLFRDAIIHNAHINFVVQSRFQCDIYHCMHVEVYVQWSWP